MMLTGVVDTAIVDIRMPGVSGIDVLAGLKQMDMAIEVIILTAYQTLETARQAPQHSSPAVNPSNNRALLQIADRIEALATKVEQLP